MQKQKFTKTYIKFHWTRGKHNNFCTCCIIWFLIRDYSGWVWFISRPFIYPIWLRLTYVVLPEEYQYVRCPICKFRGKFVEMHKCSLECHYLPGGNKARQKAKEYLNGWNV